MVGKQRCDIATINRPPGLKHPRDVAEHFDRVDQILHRHRDQHGIVRARVERQPRVPIQVVHDSHVESRVRGELGGIHAKTGDRRIRARRGRCEIHDDIRSSTRAPLGSTSS